MRYSKLAGFFVWLLCAASLAACAAPGGTVEQVLNSGETSGSVPLAEATESEAAASETYSDPFAYCAGVGTVDAPDEHYVGPDVPDSIAEGLREVVGIAPDAPQDWIVQGTQWRCMNGQVYACFVGANIPCWTRADTDRTPTEAVLDYCEAQPNADVIPAAVTGRETIYAWRCSDGQPEIVRQVSEIDEEGYQELFWYEITPP